MISMLDRDGAVPHRLPSSAVVTVQSLAGLIPLAALAFAFEDVPAPAASPSGSTTAYFGAWTHRQCC